MTRLDTLAQLELLFERVGLPKPVREYRFSPPRRWRFDYAWLGLMLAVEYEGGKWQVGGHQRPEGFEGDCEKYNTAALLGWKVLRFTGDMVEDGRAEDMLLGLKGGIPTTCLECDPCRWRKPLARKRMGVKI